MFGEFDSIVAVVDDYLLMRAAAKIAQVCPFVAGSSSCSVPILIPLVILEAVKMAESQAVKMKR